MTRAAAGAAARVRQAAPRTAAAEHAVVDRGAWLARAALALVLAATAFAVDPSAEAAFDAPKRLLALVGVAAAAVVLVWPGTRGRSKRRGRGRVQRVAEPPQRAGVFGHAVASGVPGLVVTLTVLAVAGLVVAAVASRHPAAARDSVRVALVVALLLPIGASRALASGGGLVLGAFVTAVAVNAGIAVAQALGVAAPFAVESIAGRVDAGALIGNEGHLAQLLVFALVAVAALALGTVSRGVRVAALTAVPIYVAGIVATRNLTAVMTAAVALAVLVVLVYRKRATLPLATVALVLAAAGLATPPLRARLVEVARDARAGAWDSVVTYRLGPWAAALEMIRERPLRGVGPGAFAAEFVPHRLAAEVRYDRRFTIPLITSTFADAHSDYLQLAAEGGLPTAACAVVAGVLLLGAFVRQVWRAPSTEGILLATLLAAAAVTALTWFPLQRPTSAAPLALAAGRAWRLLAGPDTARVRDVGPRWVSALVVGALLLAAIVPEIARYDAERQLRAITSATQAVLTDPARVREPVRVLAALDAAALGIAPALAGDSRPLILAGSTRLVSGDARGALERYARALALGERAEIVLNIGRAYDRQGDRERAVAAFTRAVWVSPALVAALPAADQVEVAAAVERAAARLARGELAAPPAPP